MQSGANFVLPTANEGTNRTIYFYKGSKLLVSDIEIPKYHSAALTPNAKIKITALEDDCSILLLQGRPIGEPVVQYGPFVMNSREKIQQTYEEYQRTQFGGWPWPVSDPVHGNQGRFAQHADGRLETKG